MKKYFAFTILSSSCLMALVSCEQPSRIVDHPVPNPPYIPENNQATRLDDNLNNDALNSNNFDPTIGSSGGDTIGDRIPNKNDAVINTPNLANQSIPLAWPDPNDPTVVRSPYDQTKKIRILKSDGTTYPSGTVLWDTNYPKSEGKKFRVP